MDQIWIRDLVVPATIGVHDEERHSVQPLIVNIWMTCDLRPAGRSDRIEETVNYREVQDEIMKLAEESRDHLLERLAERMAAVCLSHARVARVRIRLEKPRALRHARSAGVEIERSREEAGI